MGRVFVGVDGSPGAADALRWAVARRSYADDDVVAVLVWHLFDQGHRPGDGDLRSDFGEDEAAALLDAAVADAGVEDAVTTRTVHGVAAESLVELAQDDDLIVVGARGLGGFQGLLLGSVSLRVLESATCPVVVLHGAPRAEDSGEIVVGVDGSEDSIRALHWAAGEARASASALRIVQAWQAPLYPEMAVPQILDALEEGARDQLADITADAALEGLTVHSEAPCAGAAHALLAHEDARMLVIGSRGHGKLARLFLGSVSRQVAQHATPPVVVV